MLNDATLPFDALRPFKSKPEEFTPKDTLPWAAQAEQFLRCRTDDGFAYFRPAQQIEADVSWLVEHLALPPGAAILDIGCGPGMYSNRLGAYGYRVTGVDIAQPFLDYAQAEAQAARLPCVYQHLSLFDLAFTSEFEVVLLLNSIVNRLTLTELEPILVKIRTALKPGGHFIGEFSISPDGFAAAEPSITESVSLLAQSPWSDQFHAWLARHLTFPDTNERVTHHLILTADSRVSEYWSRFSLYPLPDLLDLLARCGFQVNQTFGNAPGRPHQPADEICFIWAWTV